MKTLLVWGILLSVSFPAWSKTSIYDLSFKSIGGSLQSMAQYKGKTLVLVNTASRCGYTGQLDDLQKLYEQYSKKGLEIIGFPSSSFKQELSSNEKVAKFCKLNYGVKFPMSSIVKVKGKGQHPIFQYLVAQDPEKGGQVRWNFEKSVVSPEGKVIKRFRSSESPSSKAFKKVLEEVIP